MKKITLIIFLIFIVFSIFLLFNLNSCFEIKEEPTIVPTQTQSKEKFKLDSFEEIVDLMKNEKNVFYKSNLSFTTFYYYFEGGIYEDAGKEAKLKSKYEMLSNNTIYSENEVLEIITNKENMEMTTKDSFLEKKYSQKNEYSYSKILVFENKKDATHTDRIGIFFDKNTIYFFEVYKECHFPAASNLMNKYRCEFENTSFVFENDTYYGVKNN